MRSVLVLGLLIWAGMPVRAAEPSAELGALLSEQATSFLAQLLGPGRARALVSVELERRETHTVRELAQPLETGEAQKTLPGYPRKVSTAITTRDDTLIRNDMVIKRLRVTAVLDTSLTDAQVTSVRQSLPDFLMLEEDRGDDLAVVRVPPLPPPRPTPPPAWKDALRNPEVLSALLLALTLLICVFFTVLAAYSAAMHAVGALRAELAARRELSPPAKAPPLSPLGAGLPPLEGELLGETPVLTGTAAADAPALGRRFDFLSSRKPGELAKALEGETAEDLAQLFAYLATADADLAGSLFSALEGQRQSAVSQKLATLKVADPDRLASFEDRLKKLVELGVRGPDSLGRILSRLPPEQREGLIGEIVSASPETAAEVERSLFPFEDVGLLKPADLRRLLSSIPYEEWGAALRGTSTELSDLVLKELPPGAKEAVAAALQSQSPRARVLEARSRILTQLQELAASGQIDLGRGVELL